MIGAGEGAPLAIGYGDGDMYLGSDALALAPFTDRIAYLEEGDWVVMTREGADIRDGAGNRVRRVIQRSPPGSLLAERGNYRHFMAKEIHEQPEVVGHTLAHYVDMAAMRLRPFAWPVEPKKLSRLSIVACGTAYMAGLIGKYWDQRRGLRLELTRSQLLFENGRSWRRAAVELCATDNSAVVLDPALVSRSYLRSDKVRQDNFGEVSSMSVPFNAPRG